MKEINFFLITEMYKKANNRSRTAIDNEVEAALPHAQSEEAHGVPLRTPVQDDEAARLRTELEYTTNQLQLMENRLATAEIDGNYIIVNLYTSIQEILYSFFYHFN